MIRRLLLAAVAATMGGCGSMAQVQLAPKAPAGPKPETVEAMVCRGDFDSAYRYLEDLNVSRPQRAEWIEKAREKVAPRPECCAGTGCAEKPEGGK